MDETYEQKMNHISQEKRKKWQNEQIKIKKLIKEIDELTCSLDKINLVAGVDISFSSKYNNGACAGLLIYNIIKKKIVYEDYEYVVLKEDYIPGFLAFRQLGPTLHLFDRLKEQKPELWPQVIIVDGNGILHKRQCGYASHLGVLLNTPSFGCGKSFYDMDGLHQSEVEEYLNKKLKYHGQFQILKGKSGRSWCTAILSDQNENKHIYLSVGTKISLDSATKLALSLLKYETPQPIRLVDKMSRKKIRSMTKQDYQHAKSYDMHFI